MKNTTFIVTFKESKKFFPATRTVKIATCDERNARLIAYSIYGKKIDIISIEIASK